jgi:hypothetical protein
MWTVSRYNSFFSSAKNEEKRKEKATYIPDDEGIIVLAAE